MENMNEKMIVIKKQLDQLIAANVESVDVKSHFEELLLALIDGATKMGFTTPIKQAYNQGITDTVKIYSFVLNKTVSMIDNEVIMKETQATGTQQAENVPGPVGSDSEVSNDGTTGRACSENPCEDELPFDEESDKKVIKMKPNL